MLTLNDGRAELWQWDTGRTLAVDADCSQVHFSNKVFGRSIDVDVIAGSAIIPDVLLQTDKDLNVWAFVGTAENGYTKISKTFKVNRRNKPADYVFTPPEQTTLAELVEQIGNLDELTTEAKDNLVAAINEAAKSGGEGGTTDHSKLTNRNADDQHPMSAITGLLGALGGKVSVADIINNLTTNAANKPLSAAQGVALKALIDAIRIPEKLPNPNALTFTGAVSGSYDGSEAKTINIPSGGASGDYIPVPATAEVGQTVVVKAVDDSGKPTAWEAVDMPSGVGGVEIDISRQPDLILEVSKTVVSLSISEINGEPIDTTEMAVLWEHPGGAQYIPNYLRFNSEVKNSTVADTAIANFNIPPNACPSNTTAAAILCRVKKINNGTYWYEFSGLQQNVGTITGTYPAVYGAPYRNNLIGETSIKEFYVYQASNIQEGCKVSVWVK